MRKIALICACFLVSMSQLWAQSKEVTGKITDSRDGTGLAGVTIKVKGTNQTQLSDANGNFRVSFSGVRAVLVLTYVGFEDMEVTVTGGNISLAMVPGTKNLNEVVITGFGTQIKRDVTGNIARVKGKDIENMPTPTVDAALQGRAAGVYVNTQSGKLGQAVSVRVRGNSSISAGNQPLYVVDGVPITTTNTSTYGGATNPL